jgi:hypothetical protein
LAAGTSPREALDEWHVKVGILTGDVDAEPGQKRLRAPSIDSAIADYLRDVKEFRVSCLIHICAPQVASRQTILRRETVKRILIARLVDRNSQEMVLVQYLQDGAKA